MNESILFEILRDFSEVTTALAELSRTVPVEHSSTLVFNCGRLSGLCIRLSDNLALAPEDKERAEAVINGTWRACHAILNPTTAGPAHA